jgi:hypothetical protein
VVELRIKYKADYGDAMTGYYQSKWMNEGREEYYTLTQFEVSAKRLPATLIDMSSPCSLLMLDVHYLAGTSLLLKLYLRRL